MGLMLGIELENNCSDLVTLALQEHLLINVTSGNVVRLLPPLIISDVEANQIVMTVCELIRTFISE